MKIPAHLAELVAAGWKLVYVSNEPTLGPLHTVTFENVAGVRTARHVRPETAAALQQL